MLHRHASPAVAGNYLLGAVAGAGVTMSLLLVLNGFLSPIGQPTLGVGALLLLAPLVLRVNELVRLELPQRAYQIPRQAFHDEPMSAARRFAFQLGLGTRTYVTATSPYALLVVVLCCLPRPVGPALAAAAATATGFGLGRSLVVLAQVARRGVAVAPPQQWRRLTDGVAVALAIAAVVQMVG